MVDDVTDLVSLSPDEHLLPASGDNVTAIVGDDVIGSDDEDEPTVCRCLDDIVRNDSGGVDGEALGPRGLAAGDLERGCMLDGGVASPLRHGDELDEEDFEELPYLMVTRFNGG